MTEEWTVPDPSPESVEHSLVTNNGRLLISQDGTVAVELIEPTGIFGPTVVVSLPNGNRVLIREAVDDVPGPNGKHTVVQIMGDVVELSAGKRKPAPVPYPHPKVDGNHEAIIVETRKRKDDE